MFYRIKTQLKKIQRVIYIYRNTQELSEVFSPLWPLINFLFRTFHPETAAEEMPILRGAVEFLAIA